MIHLSTALIQAAAAIPDQAQQGSCMDCDGWGAISLIPTFRAFGLYAGCVVSLGSSIFAGIRPVNRSYQEAIPGLAAFALGIFLIASCLWLPDHAASILLGTLCGLEVLFIMGFAVWKAFSLARRFVYSFRRRAISLQKDTL